LGGATLAMETKRVRHDALLRPGDELLLHVSTQLATRPWGTPGDQATAPTLLLPVIPLHWH
jgi:hypothetical protein